MRSIYEIDDPTVAADFVTQLAQDLQDREMPPEVRSLGRTLKRWQRQIVRLAPSPRDERTDRGLEQPDQEDQAGRVRIPELHHYRIRVLLYAGRPNWDLLATATPR